MRQKRNKLTVEVLIGLYIHLMRAYNYTVFTPRTDKIHK